ncbi:CaiB/BaiF CoA transferase family protein [Janthinobacterium sp. NFX145]|uniref:CaiB/BaiF CoA transferase family protein n=1 Tax=Janthinobacterium sp. NFX145 TaxID=3415602 RepID=UPI003CC51BA9
MKLEGIRVLDLSQFLPGPHLTMMMADHGAEVIKIEPPGGEPVRQVGLRQNGHSVWFRNTHRNKRCMALNLKRQEAVQVVLRLARDADVFVEAFRPGVMQRLGLGYEALRAVNPRIVYCSISAYGQTGPNSQKPAHDLSIQAESGLVSVNLGADGAPAMPGLPAADMAGSLMALSAILMALLRRASTGNGDYIDLSMQDALLAWTPNVMGPVFAEQRAPVVKEERSWGGAAFYGIYATADGRHLTLGGSEIKFAENLLAALGRSDLLDDCRQPPGPAQDAVREFLRTAFASRTLMQWQTFLTPLDVCWAPVNTLHEALHTEHVRARGMRPELPAGQPHLGIPIRFADEPGRLDARLEELGESTDAVLAELGYDLPAIAALRAAGAL